MNRTATLSQCGHFRYRLTRWWGDGKTLLWVMLNPSTADADQDDPTIRKCIRFAKAHGYDALQVVNLFAYRATSPRDLRDAGWPVGPENDDWIQDAAWEADGICLAWGAFASRTPRAGEVIRLLRKASATPLQCLHVTQDGHPSHPLYLPGDTRLRPFPLD